MRVLFNMIDGSELYINNVKSIVDVGRDLRITFDFVVMEPGTIVDMYISKVGQVHKDHFMNCVTSYQSEELGAVLVDYYFYDLNNDKVHSRTGSNVYKKWRLGGSNNDEK